MADGNKSDDSEQPIQIQPGQVISPGGANNPSPAKPEQAEVAHPQTITPPPQTPVASQQPQQEQQIQPLEPQSNVDTTDEQQPDSFYNPDSSEEMEPQSDMQPISWSASEYVEHEKNGGWYFVLALAALGIAAFVYLITRDTISAGVVIFGALALGIYGARPPRQLEYQVDNSGLAIASKRFGYNEFKSFAIVPEGGINSVIFVHHKRFAPLTTIYLDPQTEDEVISLLSARLPMEEHRVDPVEHLMRRIRF